MNSKYIYEEEKEETTKISLPLSPGFLSWNIIPISSILYSCYLQGL